MRFIARKCLYTIPILLLLFHGNLRAESNKFIDVSDFSGFHTEGTFESIFGTVGGIKIDVSFEITNVSSGGISLVLTPGQARDFRVSHGLSRTGCRKVSFGTLPIIDYNKTGEVEEEVLRRFATYLPEGDSMLVTVNMECKSGAPLGSFSLKQGAISGRITVIQGRRILTRPISGRF